MKFRAPILFLLLVAAPAVMLAQVASHAPTRPAMSAPAANDKPSMSLVQVPVTGRAVLRVNGRELTDRDLLHEMYALFPYAEQHGGFPQSLQSDIRKGAMQMLAFEELVYQEAERRKMTVSTAKIDASEASLRKQLGGPQMLKTYIDVECKGSRQALRQKIRRSLLIDELLKIEVNDKAVPPEAVVRDFYNKNIAKYSYPDGLHIQTISIISPRNLGADVRKEARKQAEKAYELAKKAKDYKEFGLVAEKHSDDDWHVKQGDHGWIDTSQLPPPIVAAAAKMKPGEISPLIELDGNYTFFRLVERRSAGKQPYTAVRAGIKEDLRKTRIEQFRGALNQKLHKGAKIEEL